MTVGTTWTSAAAEVDDEEARSVPTLDAIPLRSGGVAVAVLVAGEDTAVLLSEHGNVLSSMELPVGHCAIAS